MPDDLIWSYRADQGLRALEKLARDAKVSLEAAASRLIERSRKPAVFMVIEGDGGPGLCVRYAKVQDLPLFVPRGVRVDEQSVFCRAARSGARERDTGRLPSRSRRLFHIEAKSFRVGRGAGVRERVLALALPLNAPAAKPLGPAVRRVCTG